MAWPKTYFQNWPPDYFLTQSRHKQGHSKEGVKLLPLQEIIDYIESIIPIIPPSPHDHSRLLREITQAGHGFVPGDVLRFDSTYQKAQADSAENAEVVGIVYSVSDINTFNLLLYGYAHRVKLLTINTTYFLSPITPGAITAIAPTTAGQVSKPLLRTITTDSFYFYNWRGIEITAQSDIKSGRTAIADGSNALNIAFPIPFADTNYSISAAMQNTIDAEPSMYSFIITRHLANGFTVEFMGEMDSANYSLEWVARHD